MGFGMAVSLLRAGVDLRVWNRSADKAAPLAEQGATLAASVTEAVEGADVVITMLYDADSVLEVLDEARKSLARRALLIQTISLCSTPPSSAPSSPRSREVWSSSPPATRCCVSVPTTPLRRSGAAPSGSVTPSTRRRP